MRVTLGLSPIVPIGLTILLLLGAAIVVRYAFDLVREAKSLTASVKRARDRLQDAAIEVRVESEEAAERAARLGRRTSGRADRGSRSGV